MTCASCGKHIPGGARYCIHCGAEQSVPTPIAAVAAAASLSRAARAQAANAAQAEPRAKPLAQAANQPTATQPGERAHPALAPSPAPAYVAGPRRGGVAAALFGACVVVGIAVVVVMELRTESGAPDASSVMDRMDGEAVGTRSATPRADADATRSQSATSSTPSDAAAAPGADSQRGAPQSGAAPSAQESSKAAAASGEPIEIRPLPPKPGTARTGRHPGTERTAPATAAAPSARPSETVPTPTPAPVARAPAQVASATPAADRWTRMDDELSRCTREDFIARVVCGQRVRFRYCDGYWGKVDQCPASPAPERGQ